MLKNSVEKRFNVEKKTVLDRQTNLMWSLDASLSELPMTWSEAFYFVESLNRDLYQNYGDWRLPNRRELLSLISHDRTNPALPFDHPFENVFHGYYWSASTCARLPRQAWYIHFGGAKVYRGMKYASYMIWPVRSMDSQKVNVFSTGQHKCFDDLGNTISCSQNPVQQSAVQAGIEWPQPRFAADENTVTDRLTRLTWTRNARYSERFITWKEAWNTINTMNSNMVFGFDDWRLPHVRELDSLVDLEIHSPALPANHPFTDIQEFYWSGTTSIYETRYAWALYLQDGSLGVGFKENPEFFLWPVRGKAAISLS